MLPVFDQLFGFCWERHNSVKFSENIKCGNLNKNRVIYHNDKKRIIVGLFIW